MIYAIGDIHGRLDLLEKVLDMIEDFAKDMGDTDIKVVFLGDYVDRGPQSREVIERIMDLTAESERFIALKGNHEEMMVEGLMGGRDDHRFWTDNGGNATLQSYDGHVPQSHIDWLNSLPLYHETATHIFVHAGIQYGTDMKAQSPQVMMWVREQFLRQCAPLGHKHVVHGHSWTWAGKPVDSQPELLPYRTNLDTKAYHTGVLSVGVFSSEQAEAVCVLSTDPEDQS